MFADGETVGFICLIAAFLLLLLLLLLLVLLRLFFRAAAVRKLRHRTGHTGDEGSGW